MTKEIDKLKNCPNCGSIIDDSGRCQHCGSKLYDLFDIDLREGQTKNFIRIKTNAGVIIAPVMYKRCDITSTIEPELIDFCDGKVLHSRRMVSTIELELLIVDGYRIEG